MALRWVLFAIMAAMILCLGTVIACGDDDDDDDDDDDGDDDDDSSAADDDDDDIDDYGPYCDATCSKFEECVGSDFGGQWPSFDACTSECEEVISTDYYWKCYILCDSSATCDSWIVCMSSC